MNTKLSMNKLSVITRFISTLLLGGSHFQIYSFRNTSVPYGLLNESGSKKCDYIRQSTTIRRVFIIDDVHNRMLKHLNFPKGVTDFNLIVSSEALPQHKSLKVIKKKHICKPHQQSGRLLTRSIMTLFRKNFIPLRNQKDEKQQKAEKKCSVKKDEL